MTQIAGEAQRSLGRNDLIQPELRRGFSKNLGLSRSMLFDSGDGDLYFTQMNLVKKKLDD